MDTTQSPVTAPAYALHRVVNGAIDSADIVDPKRGMNMASFEEANVQIVPSAGANPDVEILFWSDSAAKFVHENSPVIYGGTGNGKAYEITGVKARRRRIFVFVTGTVPGGETVNVYVNGALAERS